MRNQKIKKVLALCLTLCLVVGIAPVSFAAQPNEIRIPRYMHLRVGVF